MTVTFTNLNLGTNDFIAIINGNSSQHTFLETLNSSNNFTTGSLTFTSSAENGCLTLIFGSDGSDQGSGWNATYNCQNTAGNNVLICQETDCVGGCARTVCSIGTYSWQNAELVSFDGYHNNGVNRLHWETETEVESSHFIVERSLNSFDWEVLGIVNGSGSSDQPLDYTLDDSNPYYPLNYYRLKHVNFNGEITLHRTISLSGMIETNDWISAAFPNPAVNDLSIIHNDPDLSEPMQLELISNLGQIVYNEEVTLQQKVQGHTIILKDMAYGIYTLRIRKGERQHIERVIIVSN